jgi:hypothetical protein
MFEMERSIRDIHTEMLEVIPEDQVDLITHLKGFIANVQNLYEHQLKSKIWHIRYLHVLLEYMPKRPLRNSDPDWMWNCQVVFSGLNHTQV